VDTNDSAFHQAPIGAVVKVRSVKNPKRRVEVRVTGMGFSHFRDEGRSVQVCTLVFHLEDGRVVVPYRPAEVRILGQRSTGKPMRCIMCQCTHDIQQIEDARFIAAVRSTG
jgi:hypothetical protein